MFASSHGRRNLVNAYGVRPGVVDGAVCAEAAALRSRTIGSCPSTATSCDCTARLVAASPRK